MSRIPQIILSWRKKLALLLYPIDKIELIRTQLGSINYHNLSYSEDEDELKRLYFRCFELEKDKYLSIIFDKLISTQVNFIAKEARDMDLVAFGRGSINGVSLVKEELQRLASIHEENIRRPVEYDKFDVI